jgi:molybdopterin converting factor small subunit
VTGAERADVGQVTLRYWAALRDAAGTTSEQVPPGRLDQVLATAVALHAATPRFGRVLAICSVLVDEEPVGGRDHRDVPVDPGAVVDLLPPFAGG